MAKQNIGVSAGIIPWFFDKETNQTYFLMSHPSNKPKNYWLYMRGMAENWEKMEETALREFHEESGVDISQYKDSIEYLGMIKQREGKNVVAYSLQITDGMPLKPFDVNGMFSNMCCGGTIPEVDEYKWMSLEDVIKYTHETNIPFFVDIIKKQK